MAGQRGERVNVRVLRDAAGRNDDRGRLDLALLVGEEVDAPDIALVNRERCCQRRDDHALAQHLLVQHGANGRAVVFAEAVLPGDDLDLMADA